MTPEEVKLVQDSFMKVAPIADTAAKLFYDKLFELDPKLKPLFPDDLTAQGKKLMEMIGTAVNNLHQVEKIVPAVQELGRKHVGYGVKDKDYDTVGAALFWTLEAGLKEDFTAPVKEAWTKTYTTLSSVMKEAAAAVPPPVPQKQGFFARMFGA